MNILSFVPYLYQHPSEFDFSLAENMTVTIQTDPVKSNTIQQTITTTSQNMSATSAYVPFDGFTSIEQLSLAQITSTGTL